MEASQKRTRDEEDDDDEHDEQKKGPGQTLTKKQQTFRKRRFDRVVLCDYMFKFVIRSVEHFNVNTAPMYVEVKEGRMIQTEQSFKTGLPNRICRLFRGLTVCILKDHNALTVKLERIFLAKTQHAKEEEGGFLLNAILQGLKMGVLWLGQEESQLQCKLQISEPYEPTWTYLHLHEQLPSNLWRMSTFSMHLDFCRDGKSHYWNLHADLYEHPFQDERTLIAVNKKHKGMNASQLSPLIAGKEALFDADGTAASCIGEHVQKLLYENYIRHIHCETEASVQGSLKMDAVVQAVFKQFDVHVQCVDRQIPSLPDAYAAQNPVTVCEKVANIHVTMEYHEAFVYIDLLPRIMAFLFQKCNILLYKQGDMLIKSITVEQPNARGTDCKSMTHTFFVNDDEGQMAMSMCLRCMKHISFV